MSARGLYTPQILAKAMELNRFPWDELAGRKGAARSRSCGSLVELSVAVRDDGRITALGVRPHACAVGQAAAAIFAESALGRNAADLAEARQALASWLAGSGEMPDWPGIALLEPALAYPARHAAILLAWDAALQALD